MGHRYKSPFRSSTALAGLWLFVMALVFAACSSQEAGPTKPQGCAVGEFVRADGTCLRAGLPLDMPCPPGEMLLDDGITCQKAGVPPSACGTGFVPDGKDGCEPILPADPCPAGQMAVPGDTQCHEVAPCGSGTWGDIPVEANTQFVDQAYAGGNSDGTQAHPWTTIQQGIDATEKNAIVAVAAGSYAEDVFIALKPVRLWGRCPAMVEVTGAGVEFGAIRIPTKAASGSELRGLSVTGSKVGIVVWYASNVVIEQVWVHDTGDWGLNFGDVSGPTGVLLKGSLIENSNDFGLFIRGSNAAIEGTVVRSTTPITQDYRALGIGIDNNPDTGVRSKLTMHAALIEQNQGLGVGIFGSDATIESSVVRSNMPNAVGDGGWGIRIGKNSVTKERANVTIRASFIEENTEHGVVVDGSDATIDATVIRSTLPGASQEGGYGIFATDGAYDKDRANVTVRTCLVEQNHSVGVSITDSDATIEATLVRATSAAAQGAFGIGNGIIFHGTVGAKARTNGTVHACLIEGNEGAGVYVFDADATIEASVIRSTVAHAPEVGTAGISILGRLETNTRANAIIRACLIEQNQETGVYFLLSEAKVESTVVRDTQKTQADGSYGDGIFVQESTVAIKNTEVTNNARAGVANFSGLVALTDDVVTCNGFDLDYETSYKISGSFDGSAGHQCSRKSGSACAELGTCNADSAGLAPQAALPPPDPVKL